jgi:hypothetical protein
MRLHEWKTRLGSDDLTDAHLITSSGEDMAIRTRVLPKSFKLAVSLLICSAGAVSSSWSQSPQESHAVVGRVQIPAVTQVLKLAEPNPISIRVVVAERVTSVVASWTYYVGNIPHPAAEEDSVLPVSYDSNGVASVDVTPLKLGKAQLTLFISFADRQVERKTINVQVVPPQQQPEKLVITLGGSRSDTPVLYLDLSEAHKTKHIDPAAIYKNVTTPVPLNASDVTFKLINSPGAAAEIDPSTGIVTARYVGQALLETSFAGVSTLTCIDVMNDVRGGPRSRCEELLPPGRRLPPSGMELDPTPPPVVKARAH